MKKQIQNIGYPIIGGTIILFGWWIAFVCQQQEVHLIPSPFATFEKLFLLFRNNEILKDLFETLFRMLAGYFLACVFGRSCGLLLGSFPISRKIFDGVIDFMRSIPVTALYPVFVLSFGIGSQSKIVQAIFAKS